MNILNEKRRLLPFHGYRIIKNKAPDTSRADGVAETMAGLSKEQWQWVQDQYAKEEPRVQAAADRQNEVSDAQLEAMRFATDEARKASAFEHSSLRPLQQQIVREARDFDTEAERERLAGLAAGDVQQAASAARGQTMRVAASMGINPADGAMASALAGAERDTALGVADAKNKARTQASTMATARKMDAAAMLQGLPGNQATQAGLAQGSGQIAAATGLQALTPGQQAVSGRTAGFNAAMSGLSGAGNIFGQSAKTKASGSSGDAALGAVGNVLGRFAGSEAGSAAMAAMFSDKNMKVGRKPASDEDALEATRAIPIETWSYKDDSPAADGGKLHVGPMAQKVAAAAGMDVAPGGTKIDPVDMNGLMLGAVRALDKKVTGIAAAAGMSV